MLPLELKFDKEGLLYTDDDSNLYKRLISLDKREYKNEFYASYFIRLKGNDDYIIKTPVTLFTKKEREQYKELLIRLIEKQKVINNTEFPIGYFKHFKKLAGLIIRYYKDGISLDNITKEKDINLIGKYYFHDDDNIRNLFLLFNEILDNLYEMFENGVYYTDIHSNNFIVNDNKIKVIDFDPGHVLFSDRNKNTDIIIARYLKAIYDILENYQLPNNYYDNIQGFNEAKIFIKKMENHVRRNI